MSRGFAGNFKKSIFFTRLAAVTALFLGAAAWQEAPAVPAPVHRPNFGYGANVADLANASRLRELGFGWMKAFVSWEGLEPKPGEYDWTNLSKATVAAHQSRLGLVLRVDRAPDWARPGNFDPTAPPNPTFLGDWGNFLEAVAQRGRGHVAAYEIWNEPNLAWEWGGRTPDPSYYVEMLRIAYRAIKSADPEALVVSAGLAPTLGDGGREAVGNLAYLRAMYEQGAGPYFDVLGSHPYGFASPPDANPHAVASFRSAELEREIMVEYGDAAKAVWATETGWLLGPEAAGRRTCRDAPDLKETLWQALDQQEQALYLVGAYRYAYDNWPWMSAIFLFNLDFSIAPWYSNPCEPMTFYSLLGPDGKPRAAFQALQEMPKW